jgi:hypothetical protein
MRAGVEAACATALEQLGKTLHEVVLSLQQCSEEG